MSRFRIVRREDPVTRIEDFVAQKKWFGLFWVDLPFCSFSSVEGAPEGAENPSRSLTLVENYVHHARRSKIVVEYD